MPFLPILAGLWGNPLARLFIVGGAAFAFGWVKGFGAVPRPDIAAIERNAIAGRDAHWQTQIQRANHEHERELSEAINAADAVPALAADADLVKLCRTDASCRDKDRKYRYRVQGVSAN
jgi:hypothetical protein